MAFVISKKSKKRNRDTTLYYLVESYREGKKIKRRTILALGDAQNIAGHLENLENKKLVYEKEIARFESDIRNRKFHSWGGFAWRQVARMQKWAKEDKEKIVKLEQIKDDVLRLAKRYPGK